MKSTSSKRVLFLVVMAFFVALQVVVARVVSLEIGNVFRINFAFIVSALCGALLGPIPAALCGVLSDFLGFMVRPVGAYHPGFAFTAALVGLAYGYMLHNKRPISIRNIVLACLFQVVICNFLLNSVWIMSFTGNTYMQTLAVRLPVEAVQAIVKPVVLVLVLPKMVPLVEKQVHLD